MGFPKRKQLRLKNYDYSQNGVYFVTICTYNHAHLFGEIVGANLCVRPAQPEDIFFDPCENVCANLQTHSNHPEKIVEKWLGELENKYIGVSIDDYVIIPDHIHFILRKSGEHIGCPYRK